MRVTVDLSPDMIANLKDMFGRKDEQEVAARAAEDIEEILRRGAIPLRCDHGTFRAWVFNTGESKQCGITFLPTSGDGAGVDLVSAETEYKMESRDCIRVYTFDDPWSECYHRMFELMFLDINAAVRGRNSEDNNSESFH